MESKKGKHVAKIADLVNAKTNLSEVDIKAYIDAHRYDHNKKPNSKDSILYQKNIEIGSRSNVLSITGRSKSRKSAIVAAILSTMFKRDNELLGFTSTLEDQDKILHVDTEQSYKDYYEGLQRAVKDAGLDLAPETFTSLYTRDAEIEMQSSILDHLLPLIKPRVLLLDGVSDFVYDINDHKEASKFGRKILKWSTENDCLVIVVIHTTKTTGFMTGALGTWFEKKSETVIKCDKPDDQQSITNVTCQYSRDVPFDPFTITFDKTLGRYIVVDEKDIQHNGKGPSKFDPSLVSEEVHEKVLRKLFLLSSQVADSDIVLNILTHVRAELGSNMTRNAALKWRDYYRDLSRIFSDPQNNWNLITAPTKNDSKQDDLPF